MNVDINTTVLEFSIHHLFCYSFKNINNQVSIVFQY